jgi:hypothetical protein
MPLNFPFKEDTLIGGILDAYPNSEELCKRLDLKCFDCVVSYEEPISEVARLHNLDARKLVTDINATFGPPPAEKGEKRETEGEKSEK